MTSQRNAGRQSSDGTGAFHSTSSFEIEKLRPGDHLCCLYRTDQEHRELLTRFLRIGLERNEKVFYIVDARTAETVIGYLEDDGVDVAQYLERGQFVILSVGESYMSGGVFDPDAMINLLKSETEKALNEGYAALRVTGEMTWALRGLPGSERLIEYESKLNEFFPGSKALAICQYDCRRFAPAILLDVLTTHPLAVVGSEVYDNFYYIPTERFLSPDREGALLERWLHNLKKAKEYNGDLERSYEELYAERDRLAVTLRSIGDGVITSDTEGNIVAFNKAAEELTGWTEQEAVGMPLQEVFHIVNEETRERCVNPVQTVLETGQIVGLANDTVLLARDGTERILADTASPMRDEAGKILGVVLVFKDFTERRNKEKEIQEREEQFRGLLERLQEAAYRMSIPDGAYEYVSPAVKLVLGYSAEEILSEPLFARRIMHPDFADYFEEAWADLLRGEVPPTYEYQVIDPDGNERWIVQSNQGIFDDTGRIVAIEGVCRDITESKRAEEELRQSELFNRRLVEYAPFGIFYLNEGGKIEYSNPASDKILGVTEGQLSPAVGANIFELPGLCVNRC
jgi:PAS domain S-box-containing protein